MIHSVELANAPLIGAIDELIPIEVGDDAQSVIHVVEHSHAISYDDEPEFTCSTRGRHVDGCLTGVNGCRHDEVRRPRIRVGGGTENGARNRESSGESCTLTRGPRDCQRVHECGSLDGGEVEVAGHCGSDWRSRTRGVSDSSMMC
jgi:hypothetical protein